MGYAYDFFGIGNIISDVQKKAIRELLDSLNTGEIISAVSNGAGSVQYIVKRKR